MDRLQLEPFDMYVSDNEYWKCCVFVAFHQLDVNVNEVFILNYAQKLLEQVKSGMILAFERFSECVERMWLCTAWMWMYKLCIVHPPQRVTTGSGTERICSYVRTKIVVQQGKNEKKKIKNNLHVQHIEPNWTANYSSCRTCYSSRTIINSFWHWICFFFSFFFSRETVKK